MRDEPQEFTEPLVPLDDDFEREAETEREMAEAESCLQLEIENGER